MGAKGSGARGDLKRMFRKGCEPPAWTLSLGQMQIRKADPTGDKWKSASNPFLRDRHTCPG